MNRTLSLLPLVLFVGSIGGAEASLIYIESGGQVTGEGELFSRRTSSADGLVWTVKPIENSGTTSEDGGEIFANYRGAGYVQALPNRNVPGGQGPTNAPSIEYDVSISTAGTYQLYLRWDGLLGDGQSDSIFADIVGLKDGTESGPSNTIPDWYEFTKSGGQGDFADTPWDGLAGFEQNQATSSNDPALFSLDAGVTTLRISMREDGSALDAWTLQLVSLQAPSGDGPQVSQIVRVPLPAPFALLGLGLVGIYCQRLKISAA